MPTDPIADFAGLTAVVTGGGTGMGRQLACRLAAEGCHVAICDVSQHNMDEAASRALTGAPAGTRVTTFIANVAEREALDAFAIHVAATFDTDRINLLFNNAGIAGGASVVDQDEANWDRVFGVCWGGVLNSTRAFLPMLKASDRGHVINTSSINGMWACLGPYGAHTAYSAAKFAVRGFTEALIVDFRINAPHLTASVVMPGHIGTSIARNSYLEMGVDPKDLHDEFIDQLRVDLAKRGLDLSGASDEDLRNLVALRIDVFENAAPTTADQAAAIILDGVRRGAWRILVGDDAHALDRLLRECPELAYTEEFLAVLSADGHFSGLIA